MQLAKKQNGFTIVELLIVVVVIAILAAITIISYNGITARANDSSMKSMAKQLEQKIRTNQTLRGDQEVVKRFTETGGPFTRDSRLAVHDLSQFKDACLLYRSVSPDDSYSAYDPSPCFQQHILANQVLQFDKKKMYIYIQVIPTDTYQYTDVPTSSVTVGFWDNQKALWTIKQIKRYTTIPEEVTSTTSTCAPFPSDDNTYIYYDSQCRNSFAFDVWLY